ncbi:MAG: glycoside hydrolase family 65 protein, partial [Flavobacteriales bacterium]
MIQYLKTHPWKIIEEGFKRKHHRSSESIFSIGNGRFGQRANHEEKYSGPSLQGSYVAGVYYPDKTRVGWWKNGYPEYFAKVLNSVNWIGIHVWLEGEEVDFATCITSNFRRELDMKRGTLSRTFDIEMPSGKMVRIEAMRFCSMADDETAAIRYSVTPLNFTGMIEFAPYLDADVRNHDSNYEEKFWEHLHSEANDGFGMVSSRTRKTEFDVAAAMSVTATLKGQAFSPSFHNESHEFYAETRFEKGVNQNETITLFKYVGVVSS